MRSNSGLTLLAALALSACATGYQQYTLLNPFSTGGGYQVIQRQDAMKQAIDGHWLVGFCAGVLTTQETAQASAFYRAAMFSLERGYDGFEIIDPSMSKAVGPAMRCARATPVVFLMEIRLLRKSSGLISPTAFDAATLKSVLEPYVTGPGRRKCDAGNVCPDLPDYLRLSHVAGSAG